MTQLRSLAFLPALAMSSSLLSLGCEPELTAKGSLSVDGVAFTPTVCQVIAGRTAIELGDGKGTLLELSLPPARLDAFKDVSGTPSAKLTRPGGTSADLGACGSLTLTGEGYHGSGKRAASGHTTLSCGSAPKVEGELSFTGCF